MEREHLAAKRQFYKSNLVWENQVSFIGLAPVIKIGRSWRKPCLLMGEESMDARIWRRCTRTGFINHFGIRGTHTKANKQIELFLEMQKKVLGFFYKFNLKFYCEKFNKKVRRTLRLLGTPVEKHWTRVFLTNLTSSNKMHLN